MKKKVAVIGSSGAIGNSICKKLINDDSVEEVYKFSRVIKSEDTDKIKNIEIDIEDEDSIKNCVQKLASNIKFDLIFVATGILHNDSDIFPEKSIRDISIDKLQKVLLVNTIGPTLVGKYFIPFLRKDSRSVFAFLSARVGSISDNYLGGWYSYRASKAALNQVVKTSSIEQKRLNENLVIVSIHPGTVDTKLSSPFIGKRKVFYAISSVLILIGIGSLVTKKLNYGVDFKGGRTFVVRFDAAAIENEELRSSLANYFVDEDGLKMFPEVKTFGDENQVKITTKYLIESTELTADDLVLTQLDAGLTQFGSYEVMSSQKVGPTIADDIKVSALWSIIFSLFIIFLYILLRFRKWQFSLGAVAAVFHDVLIVLSIFSIFYGVLPFSLEIDQAFIAALLTIIGYSLNDTVVVFDRIREHMAIYKKKEFNSLVNNALNSTLSRTVNTSLTTFFVLLVIFLFGGEVIRGFMFALMVGVVVGTYSSLFVASPIMLDTIKKSVTEKK